MRQQPFARGGRWMIQLLHFRSLPHALPQFEGRLKKVHIQAHDLKQLRQRLPGHDPREPFVAHHAANHRPVLLLDPRLIIRVMRPRPRKGDGLFLAVSRQRIVDECPIIVGVDPQRDHGKLFPDPVQPCGYQVLLAGQQRHGFHPTRANIRHDQTMEILPGHGAATMHHKVNLQKARGRILPVGKGFDWNRSAHPLFRMPAPAGSRTFAHRREQPVNRGRAHFQHQLAHPGVQLQMPVLFHRADQVGNRRL